MPTYGLIVEGEYDAAALTELIRRCAEGNIQVIPRQCAQKGSLMKKFPAYLQELHWANQGQAVDKALVIRDADGKNPGELVARMGTSIVSRSYLFPVKFVVIVQELETWLLADHEALSQVTRKRISEINRPLESITDPIEFPDNCREGIGGNEWPGIPGSSPSISSLRGCFPYVTGEIMSQLNQDYQGRQQPKLLDQVG